MHTYDADATQLDPTVKLHWIAYMCKMAISCQKLTLLIYKI